MRKLRGAVFGCGMIAEYHLRAWQRISEVEIVALGDQNLEAAEERRRTYAPEAAVYGDLPNLLERASVDFVDILTPPSSHREHCLTAKRANVHVICQKPLTEDLESARSLVAAMEDHVGLFAVHENHRYRPWFQVVRTHLQGGFFGNIRLVRWEELSPRAPIEAYKLNAEKGVMLEYGTHLVDMMRALLGEPKQALARMYRIHDAVRGESLVHATYVYDGAVAVIDAGWKSAGVPQCGFLLVGDRGEAYYEGDMRRGTRARFRLIQDGQIVLDQERSPVEDFCESFYLFQNACVQAMLGRQAPPQPGKENLLTLIATLAAYRSAAERKLVELKDEYGDLAF